MKIVFTAVLLFLWSSIEAQIRPEWSGTWYNPDQDGHGFMFQTIGPDRMIGYWYVYDQDGNPTWFMLDGVEGKYLIPQDNLVEFIAYRFTDMFWPLFDPFSLQREEVGTVLVSFVDCGRAMFTYDLGDWGSIQVDMPIPDSDGIEFFDGPPIVDPGWTWIDVVRLSSVEDLTCYERASPGDLGRVDDHEWYVSSQHTSEVIRFAATTEINAAGEANFAITDESYRVQIMLDGQPLNGHSINIIPSADMRLIYEVVGIDGEIEMTGKFHTDRTLCFPLEVDGLNMNGVGVDGPQGCYVFEEIIAFGDLNGNRHLTFFR